MAKRKFEDILASVANATVAVGPPSRRGQGVYVGNGHIITAAHCLEYDSDVGTGIALGDHILYEIETAQGERMKVSPLVIESCCDIAVLGPLDGQSFPREMVEPFESLTNRTKPVRICPKRFNRSPGKFGVHIQFGVHIRTHKEVWIAGKATVFSERPSTIFVDADESIESGTSGGPVINDEGALVGVVSIAGGSGGESTVGSCPFPRWALPAWIYHRICGKES